jgi:hypothetical protein
MKLKRCPFCNSHELTSFGTHTTYQIECLDCRALGPITDGDVEDAGRLWNNGEDGSTGMVNMRRKYTNRDDLKDIEL